MGGRSLSQQLRGGGVRGTNPGQDAFPLEDTLTPPPHSLSGDNVATSVHLTCPSNECPEKTHADLGRTHELYSGPFFFFINIMRK